MSIDLKTTNRELVAAMPVTYTWSRDLLLPLDGDLTGKVLVIRPDTLGRRYQRAKFQLFRATGGFGCKPDTLGSKVYGIHLADGEETVYRRSDFLGEATPDLIEACAADEAGPLPFDPNDMHFMAVGTQMTYGCGATEREAKAKVRRMGAQPLAVYRCHVEAYLTDFGLISYPTEAAAPTVVWQSKKVAA